MTREVALERFKQEQKPLLERCREKFMEEFPNKVSTLMERINGAFGSICNQAEEQGKEKIVYFHFSLLRCDLGSVKFHYRFLLLNLDFMQCH